MFLSGSVVLLYYPLHYVCFRGFCLRLRVFCFHILSWVLVIFYQGGFFSFFVGFWFSLVLDSLVYPSHSGDVFFWFWLFFWLGMFFIVFFKNCIWSVVSKKGPGKSAFRCLRVRVRQPSDFAGVMDVVGAEVRSSG